MCYNAWMINYNIIPNIYILEIQLIIWYKTNLLKPYFFTKIIKRYIIVFLQSISSCQKLKLNQTRYLRKQKNGMMKNRMGRAQVTVRTALLELESLIPYTSGQTTHQQPQVEVKRTVAHSLTQAQLLQTHLAQPLDGHTFWFLYFKLTPE